MDEAIFLEEALRLPARERALLAEALLNSLADEETREIEASWALEADSRKEAYQSGDISSEKGAEVIRELRDRYGK